MKNHAAILREAFTRPLRVREVHPSDIHHTTPGFAKFFGAYIEAALWASNDDGGTPLDRNYTASDIDSASLKKAEDEAHKFYQETRELMKDVDADDTQAGHDFWLTRNGHGAGFWDDPELYNGEENADALSDIARNYDECYVLVGDDGKLYFE